MDKEPQDFIEGKPAPDPHKRPLNMPRYAEGKVHPKLCDPYAGGEDPVFDREQEIYSSRMWDKEGEDSAYDMGLSPVYKPAPPGGRKLGATDIFP